MKSIKQAFTHPSIVVGYLLRRISPLIPNDEIYLKIDYFVNRGRKLNLAHPVRMNEKLQWLKLNGYKEHHTLMVDKYECKKIVGDIIGESYIIPTLGIWNSFDEIDFDSLPKQFVLKCTHDSGGLVICKDKSLFDKKAAKKRIEKSLKRNFYYWHRERPYKNVPHRIIAEKYLEDESGWQLKDYKIFCFNGEPKFVEVDYDRYVDHKLNVYDLDWKFIDFYMTSRNDKSVNIEKPAKLDEMLQLARKLAKEEVFARVDFYSIGNSIYFGEMTYCPGGGIIDFHPDEYDTIVGNMLKLPID